MIAMEDESKTGATFLNQWIKLNVDGNDCTFQILFISTSCTCIEISTEFKIEDAIDAYVCLMNKLKFLSNIDLQ